VACGLRALLTSTWMSWTLRLQLKDTSPLDCGPGGITSTGTSTGAALFLADGQAYPGCWEATEPLPAKAVGMSLI